MIKKLLVFVAMLLISVVVSVQAQEIKITTADGNGADCYITNDEQSAPNYHSDTFHGGEAQLKMRNLEGVRMKLILLRFDVSTFPSVKDAMIGYNVTWFKGNTTTIFIYGLVNEDLDNWDELNTCYDNAPGFVPTSEGIPVGYYDITEDLMLVGSASYSKNDVPDSSGLGWYYSTPSDTMDTFINDDTNGIVTFALIPDPGPDADWAISSKEDSVIYAPMLTAEEAGGPTEEFDISTADGNGADCYITNDEQSAPNYHSDTFHGGETQLKMRNLEGVRMKLILLRFDVSSLSDVKDAMIGYNVTWFKGNTTTIFIYGLVNEDLDNWDELNTCYDNAPGFVPTSEGIPVGYYDITEDLMLVGSASYSKNDVPDSSGLGWYYSTPSDTMDTFINDDTNGMVTFALIPDPGPDADWAISSKEDSVIYAPRLTGYQGATAISMKEEVIPSTHKLSQNYPNPFNPKTTIEFNLEKPGYTKLEIYNLAGQLVSILVDGQLDRGSHRMSFNAANLPTGIYLYKLTTDNFSEVKKMMLLK